jgi:hypothetical protein
MSSPRHPGNRSRGPEHRTGPLPLSEDEFLRWVIDTARWYKWKVTHFRAVKLPSGRWATPLQGDKGFPDLALARAGVVILAELKTDVGHTSTEQGEWLEQIGSVVGRVWRPSMRDAIVAELSHSVSTRGDNGQVVTHAHRG